jgi:NADH:ubiquinone oxidoreductase subunit 2 (subunit N)
MIWKNSTTLLTWQKIAPVFLLIYQIKWFVFPFIIMSATVGRISQMNKINVIEIIAFSSIFNLRWMILALIMNTKLLLIFSTIYWTSVIIAILIIYTTKIKKINRERNDKTKKWIYLIVILNLAGIPPLAGFLAKWIVFREGIVLKIYFLITLLLIRRSVNLYIYMRVINFFITKNSDKTQKRNKQVKKSIIQNVTVTRIFPLGIISL